MSPPAKSAIGRPRAPRSGRLAAVLRLALRAGVSAGLLLLVLWMSDWRLIVAKLTMLSPAFVLFAWLYYGGLQYLSAYRWKLLLSARGAQEPVGRLFALYMIGMFANNFLPSGLGGDAVKAYGLYSQGQNSAVSVASVVVERLCGILALAALGAVPALLLLLGGQAPLTALACLGAVIGIGAGAAALWSAPAHKLSKRLLTQFAPASIGGAALRAMETVHSYPCTGYAFRGAFALSLVIQASIAGYYSLVSLALGTFISPLDFLLFLPILTIITLLPISLGGLGVREIAMVYLFSAVNVAREDILAVSLVAHALNLGLSLLGGAFLMLGNFRAGAQSRVSALKLP
jgi:glycosyltransferase 2 family protein